MAQRVARSAAQILSAPAAAPVASKSLAEAQQRARYFFREVRARPQPAAPGALSGAVRASYPPARRCAHACRPASARLAGSSPLLRRTRRTRRAHAPRGLASSALRPLSFAALGLRCCV